MGGGCFDQIEAYEEGPGEVFVVVVGQPPQEEDVAVGELACLLHGVHVLELDEGGGVGAEAILLHVEGHEDAVDAQHQELGVDAVEHVVVDLHGDFAFHAVGLA